MNGRYIFHLFSFMALLIAQLLMVMLKRSYINIFMILAFILLAVQGAGIITYAMDDFRPVFGRIQ